MISWRATLYGAPNPYTPHVGNIAWHYIYVISLLGVIAVRVPPPSFTGHSAYICLYMCALYVWIESPLFRPCINTVVGETVINFIKILKCPSSCLKINLENSYMFVVCVLFCAVYGHRFLLLLENLKFVQY